MWVQWLALSRLHEVTLKSLTQGCERDVADFSTFVIWFSTSSWGQLDWTLISYGRTAWRIKQLQCNRLRSKIKSLNTSSSIAALSRKRLNPGNTVVFSLYAKFFSTVVSDMKSKSLDVTVVCGPVLAGCWQAAAADELRCKL